MDTLSVEKVEDIYYEYERELLVPAPNSKEPGATLRIKEGLT